MAISSIQLHRNFLPPRANSFAVLNCNRFGNSTVSFGAKKSRALGVVARGRGRSVDEDCPLVDDAVDDLEETPPTDLHPKIPERDFSGTARVPVYVMFPLGVVDMNCELVYPEGLSSELKVLKAANVDGVMIDCWWGIVEAHSPQVYNWTGYKQLFQIVRDLELKLQVVMSFH